MATMSSRERVLAALRREQPDRVPYCELGVDRTLGNKLLGWQPPDGTGANMDRRGYTVDELLAVADRLMLDNIYWYLRAPVFTEMIAGQDGRLFNGQGLIKTEADLDKIVMPDPRDDSLYAGAEEFLKHKGDRAAFFCTRIGIFSAMLSMGTENFAICLYENRRFVDTVLDIYVSWAEVVAERVCAMGFDVFVSTDDYAFHSGPFLSPAIFREVIVPLYHHVTPKITIPWIMHSDGNLMPMIEDIIGLGISGLHPNEKGAMDICQMKRDYGQRICLLGNVDLNILTIGTPEDVDAEVHGLIQDVGPGGGYIVTSGNSLASYVRPENALALAQAVQKYGQYPLAL